MSREIKPLRRPPLLHQSVFDAIQNYILENDLKPGDPLPSENEFSRQLGVSRNSVREATRAMESLGIIETRRGSGIFVRDFSFDPILDNLQYSLLFDLRELSDLLQIRRVLETGMIETAMQVIDDPQLARMQQTVDQMRELAEQGEHFPAEDQEFHRLLFQAIDNPVLLKLLDIFWQAFNRALQKNNLKDKDPVKTYEAHRAILDALCTGDVEAAREALAEHYTDIEERIHLAQRERHPDEA